MSYPGKYNLIIILLSSLSLYHVVCISWKVVILLSLFYHFVSSWTNEMFNHCFYHSIVIELSFLGCPQIFHFWNFWSFPEKYHFYNYIIIFHPFLIISWKLSFFPNFLFFHFLNFCLHFITFLSFPENIIVYSCYYHFLAFLIISWKKSLFNHFIIIFIISRKMKTEVKIWWPKWEITKMMNKW